MRAGVMRHRVTIEEPDGAVSAAGNVSDRYVPYLHRIAAQVLENNGREDFAAGQVFATADAKIRIRYRAGIIAPMRLRHHMDAGGSPTIPDVMYDIQAVIPVDGRKVEMWLMCRRRDAEGFRTGAQG